MGTLSDYLSEVPDDQRPALQRVVDVARRVAPEAEEGMSYGMPALRYRDKPLIGVVAAAKHLSVFPFSPQVVAAVAPDLKGFSLSKGTIRFTADRPVPDEVVEKIVTLRLSEIER